MNVQEEGLLREKVSRFVGDLDLVTKAVEYSMKALEKIEAAKCWDAELLNEIIISFRVLTEILLRTDTLISLYSPSSEEVMIQNKVKEHWNVEAFLERLVSYLPSNCNMDYQPDWEDK
eukprot:scaffold15908_cov785-Ochromonas_danica.AAC.1